MYISLCLAFLAHAALAGESPPRSFALDASQVYSEISRHALSGSWSLKRTALQKLQAHKESEQVNAKLLPQVELSGQWGRHSPLSATFKEQNYAVDVTYTLYDFGRAKAESQSLIYAEHLKALSLEELSEQLSWRIARGVLRVQGAMVVRQVVADNLKTSQEKHERLRINYERGLRPEYDLAVAQADLASSELLLERADTELKALTQQLEILMGGPTQRETLGRLMDGLRAHIKSSSGKDSQEIFHKTPGQWYQTALSWPLPQMTIKRKQQSEELLRLDAQLAGVEASDDPNLLMSLEAARGGTWGQTTPGYTGLLTLRWVIPWTGQHRLDREIIALKRSQAEATMAEDQEQLDDELSQALTRLQTSQQLWSTLDKVYLAKERLMFLTKSRYEAGKASALEMTTAELDLGSAKLERARVNNSAAEAALDIAIAKRIKDLGQVLR